MATDTAVRARSDRRFLRTGAVNVAASMTGAALNVVLVVVVGRSFGAAGTGIFFTAIGIFLVLGNVLRLGADTGAVRMLSRLVALDRRHDLRPTVTVALVPVIAVGLLAAIGLWLAAAVYPAGPLAGQPAEAVGLLRALAPFVPMLGLLTVVMASTRALGGSTEFALVQNVALPATRVIGVALGAALGLSILDVTRCWAAGLPVLLIVGALALRTALRREGGASRGDPGRGRRRTGTLIGEFWSFAAPRGVAAAVEVLLDWIDVILVTLLAGPAQGGIYAVATRCVKIAQVVDYAARITVSTRLSAAMARGQTSTVVRVYELTARFMVMLVWPYLALLLIFAQPTMSLFGADFTGEPLLLPMLALAMLVSSAAGSLQSVLLLGGLSRWQLVNKSAALAVCITGNLLLTPTYGAVGGAVAWTLAVLTDTALAAVQVRRSLAVPVTAAALASVVPAILGAVVVPALAVRVVLGDSLPALVAGTVLALTLLAVTWVRTGTLADLRRQSEAIG